METGELTSEIRDTIQQSFAAQTLMGTFGARLGSLEPGRVEIFAPILPGARQQHGFAHAGLTFSIGDSAAGYAALSVMPLGSEVMTVEMKINLLSPADGERIVATGKVIKPGRRLVIVQADVSVEKDGHLKPVALLQGTMIPL